MYTVCFFEQMKFLSYRGKGYRSCSQIRPVRLPQLQKVLSLKNQARLKLSSRTFRIVNPQHHISALPTPSSCCLTDVKQHNSILASLHQQSSFASPAALTTLFSRFFPAGPGFRPTLARHHLSLSLPTISERS